MQSKNSITANNNLSFFSTKLYLVEEQILFDIKPNSSKYLSEFIVKNKNKYLHFF